MLKRFEMEDPDVVVSLHPTMNHTPLKIVERMNLNLNKKKRMVKFYTVVTDLVTCHKTWFNRKVSRLFAGTDSMKSLAVKCMGWWDISRSSRQDTMDKVYVTGLPVRDEFQVLRRFGGRLSEDGELYVALVKKSLGFKPKDRVVLVGSVGKGRVTKKIVKSVVKEMEEGGGKDAEDTWVVVMTGMDVGLRDYVEETYGSRVEDGNDEGRAKWLPPTTAPATANAADDSRVRVMALPYTDAIGKYMTAASVMVTKAGPGTLTECGALGLPVVITSELPGQEVGNGKWCEDSGFGFVEKKPRKVGRVVRGILDDWKRKEGMIRRAEGAVDGRAAERIVESIMGEVV
jgi:1,2-diacylglycerol 3-beta-galactosyltransferase